MSFTFAPVPAGGRKKPPQEVPGTWPTRYKAMTFDELCAELKRLAAEHVDADYHKRRHFILQEIDQRTARV